MADYKNVVLNDNEKAVLRAWRDGAQNVGEVRQITGLSTQDAKNAHRRFSREFNVSFGDGKMVGLANSLTAAGLI